MRKLIGLCLVLGLLAAGCMAGTRRAYIVAQQPPAPQYERAEYRPGYVWIRGDWYWDDGQWQWERGHYEPARTGMVWRDGYWEPRGDRWQWVEGQWEGGPPGVEIHDHRTQQPYQPQPGTVVVPSQTNPPY